MTQFTRRVLTLCMLLSAFSWGHATTWTPAGPVTLNKLADAIADGDTISLLSSTLDADSSYALSDNFNIGSKTIYFSTAEGESGLAYIDGNGNSFQVSTGSFYADGLEASGFKYFLQPTSSSSVISLTNCEISEIDRGVMVFGSYTIDTVIVDNCIIYHAGGGDSNPVLGTSGTSGAVNYFQLSNSTLSAVKAPIFRLTHRLNSPVEIVVDHCTMDSIYGGASSPFYSATKGTVNDTTEVTFSNNVITNVIDCSSLWDRLTVGAPANQVIEATSYYGVGSAFDSAASDTVTLASTYLNADPEYTSYGTDLASKDYGINSDAVIGIESTDLGVIGDQRWSSAYTNWIPKNSEELATSLSSFADGDVIYLLSPSEMDGEDYYATSTGYSISKTVTIEAYDSDDDKPILDLTNGYITLKNGCTSITLDNIEVTGGTYLYRVSGNIEKIAITNCNISGIDRDIIASTSGNLSIDTAIVDNCIIAECGGGSDSYPLFGTNQTSGYYGYFSLTNSTLANIKGTVLRITHKTADLTKIIIDQCTFDSLYASNSSSPFYAAQNNGVIDASSSVSITNCLFTNIEGYSSLWSRLTIADQAAETIEATSYWMVDGASDSATSSVVTLSSENYVNVDPVYTNYSTDLGSRDFTINSDSLLKLGTGGDRIGDTRWDNRIGDIYTPQGPIELNALASIIQDNDTIKLLSPSELASTDSSYVLSSSFNIGDKSITIKALNSENGLAYIDGNGNSFQVKGGSFYADGIEATGFKYFLQPTGNSGDISITNSELTDIDRGVVTSGGYTIESLTVDNCIIYKAGGGDNNPLFGTSSTSGYYGSMQITNSTLSAIKGPVFRITHKLDDATQILVDHCTIDSLYSASSPFYASTKGDNSSNSATISNTVITNLDGCSSIWSRLTIADASAQNVEATSYWGVGSVTDSAASDVVTLDASTYVSSNPEYADTSSDFSVRDYTIKNADLLTLGTDGDRIGDPRWITGIDDATLTDLTVDGTTVDGFDAATITYNVELVTGTTTIPVVAATVSDVTATVEVTQASDLPGEAKAVVTSGDGSASMTYTINFTVAASTDATLSDLAVDGTTVDGFDASTTSYDVQLAEGTTEVPEVTATTTDANATYSITDATSLPGYTSVLVTSEAGTTQTYTINFTVGTTSVDEAGSLSLNIYPNPVASDLVIENTSMISEAYIYSSNGQMVKSVMNVNSNSVEINVSDLNAGLYLINVVTVDNVMINNTFIKE